MIRGIPTNYGIEILNSELKKEVQTYALIGLSDPKDEDLEALIRKEDIALDEISDNIFYKRAIDVGYFDENGILTYEINLQNINTDKYMYAIVLIDTIDKVIASIPTPQVILTEGMGGLITIKLPIKGEISEVVFVSSEYVSREEFDALKASLKPPEVNIPELVEIITPLIQIHKDELEYLDRILDSLISHCQYVLLMRQNQAAKNEKIGEYSLFFRNELPKGYKAPGTLLSIYKYAKAYLHFKNTSQSAQENCPQGYFRLPKPNVYAKGTSDIAKVGAFTQEGLPNITKNAMSVSVTAWRVGKSGVDTGGTKSGLKDVWDVNAAASVSYDFNASKSSSIYGRSSSVEVNHNLLLEGFYIGEGNPYF